MRELILAVNLIVALALAAYLGWEAHGKYQEIACAKEHNVYECRMVAVPVAQPEWVK